MSITEVGKTLKVGTKLTVELQEPGVKKLKQASVTVKATKRPGYTEYVYQTGKLPVGTTTVRFYEKVGKKLKLVRTETLKVQKKTSKKSKSAATRALVA